MKAGAQAKSPAMIVARSRWADYLALTKPRISAMALVMTAAGFYMASPAGPDLLLLTHALIGAGLVGAGASALNQVLERQWDARMERTRERPVPAGRLTPREAAVFGTALALGGVAYLLATAPPLAGVLGLLALVLYVGVYTPLKRVTTLNTIVGAVPGVTQPEPKANEFGSATSPTSMRAPAREAFTSCSWRQSTWTRGFGSHDCRAMSRRPMS